MEYLIAALKKYLIAALKWVLLPLLRKFKEATNNLVDLLQEGKEEFKDREQYFKEDLNEALTMAEMKPSAFNRLGIRTTLFILKREDPEKLSPYKKSTLYGK